MRNDPETPFFFGADAGLFGIYHPPSMRPRLGVLMCPPLGQDLIRCHRLYRQLAQSLAARGIAALRFDYHGTGDSAGRSDDVDWERCVADTATAASELRLRAGVQRVVAFGARLGASIACATTDAGFAEVIAWDPVLDGPAYVERLDALQNALGDDRGRFLRQRSADELSGQWLGFATGSRLRTQLRNLPTPDAGTPVLYVTSAASTMPGTVSLGQATTWDDLDRLESAILSHPLIQAVTTHLGVAA